MPLHISPLGRCADAGSEHTTELGLYTLDNAADCLIELLPLCEDGDVVTHHTVHKAVANCLQ